MVQFMRVLARAGYDVFAMTHTAYGSSPKPMMDDPCNLDPKQQDLLVPKNLPAKCDPKYPFDLVNSDSEKIQAAQAAMAAEPVPVRVPRERKPLVVIDEGPLVLVETRKDLSQLKLPFETSAGAASAGTPCSTPPRSRPSTPPKMSMTGWSFR